jgi:hypothetical protein
VTDLFHSRVHVNLCEWFSLRTKSHRLHPLPRLRNRIALERSARMSEVMEKLQENKDWGVVHVWLVDPQHKELYEFGNGLREVSSFQIPEVALDLPASEIFD